MADDFVLVSTKAAPEVFLKVVEAKRLLSSGLAKKTGEAIDAVNISRSAFYKYKDYVFGYGEKSLEHVITLFLELADTSGVLSEILAAIAMFGGNVLTINQNIPINNTANVIISARLGSDASSELMTEKLRQLKGVIKVKLLSVQ